MRSDDGSSAPGAEIDHDSICAESLTAGCFKRDIIAVCILISLVLAGTRRGENSQFRSNSMRAELCRQNIDSMNSVSITVQ